MEKEIQTEGSPRDYLAQPPHFTLGKLIPRTISVNAKIIVGGERNSLPLQDVFHGTNSWKHVILRLNALEGGS